jgi:predicted RNA-binding protein
LLGYAPPTNHPASPFLNITPNDWLYTGMLFLSSLTVWILSGNVDNWERGLTESVWGVTEKLKVEWEGLKKNDELLFYCGKPVSGIIGWARAKNKFKQDKPLWKEELRQLRVIWPYRFDFEVLYVLPRTEWEKEAIRIKLGKRVMRGMSRVVDQKLVEQIYREISQRWGGPRPIDKGVELLSEHDQIKKLLVELGVLSSYIAEQEYPLPDLKERLDVVWRRVVASVPTFVFEVHIEGNIHQALIKLKHAYDVWNSNIYLVVKDNEVDRVSKYLEGALHEIKARLKIISVSKVRELYDIQKKDFQLKSEVGFR